MKMIKTPLILQNYKVSIPMNNCKRHTISRTGGNSVMFFMTLVILTFFINACEDLTKDLTGDSRDRITGTWDCSETGSISGTQAFEANIEKSGSDTTAVYVYNFYGLGPSDRVIARMSGRTLTVSRQTVTGIEIQGSGSVSSDYKTITWNFTAFDGAESDQVSSKYTAQ